MSIFFLAGSVTSSKIDCGDKHEELVTRVAYIRPIPSRNGTTLIGIVMELFDPCSFLEYLRNYSIEEIREIYLTLLELFLIHQNH